MKNLTAKHANKYNRSIIYRDRKNNYTRKFKHKKIELF
jgi:hypothetical protein